MRRRGWSLWFSLSFLLGVLGALLPAQAQAHGPDRAADGGLYTRWGAPGFCYRRVLTSNAVTYPVNVSTATSAPAAFAWGTRVRVTAITGAVTACFTMTTTVSLGDQATSSGVLLDDQNAWGTAVDGNTGCLRVPVDTSAEMYPRQLTMDRSTYPGYRAGICSGTQAVQIDDFKVRPFCDVASDCNDAGTRVSGNTCSKTRTAQVVTERQQHGGVFVVLKSPTNNAIADVCIVH